MVHELRYTIPEKGEKSMEFGTMWYSEWEGGLEAGYEDLDVSQFGGADYEVIIRVDYEGKEKLKRYLTKKYGAGKSLEWMLLTECGKQETPFEELCKKLHVQFKREVWVH